MWINTGFGSWSSILSVATARTPTRARLEVRKITAFLRRLTVETGATVLIVHHDTKPPAQQADTRRRGHKASGSDWFAASDCPIALEPAGENRTLVLPEDYKFSSDPEPFTFEIQEDTEKTWARLVGETSNVQEAADLVIHEKVVSYLAEHSAASGNAIARGCHIRRDAIAAALDELARAGRVDSVKKGPKTTWFLRSA